MQLYASSRSWLQKKMNTNDVAIVLYSSSQCVTRHYTNGCRCFSRRMDDPAGQLMLCEAWVRFERERGSREDLLYAEAKVDPIREAAAVAATDAATAAAAQVQYHVM